MIGVRLCLADRHLQQSVPDSAPASQMWCFQRFLRDRDGFLSGRVRKAKTPSPAACANVLTPDRIPEFCIPPRLEPCLALAALRNSWGEQAAMDEGASRTDWDPRSQAALSLPHLPRARTAYGFCALLESPHTRRKESLFLGDAGAAALLCSSAAETRAHTCGSDGGDGGPGCGATLASTRPPRYVIATMSRGRRLLRVPDRLLSRVLRSRSSRGLSRARSVCSGDDKDERGVSPEPACRSPIPGPWPERLQVEATVTLSRAGGTLPLVAEYTRGSRRLRLRPLCIEGPAGGALQPRALGCRLSLVLQAQGAVRMRRAGVSAQPQGRLGPGFLL
jgi:hypothetical protein